MTPVKISSSMKKAMYVLIALLVFTLLIFAVAAWLSLRQPVNQIAYGVHVAGVDLGGMQPSEAVNALTQVLPVSSTQTITLMAAEQTWPLTWAEVGQHYDIAATVKAAAEVGQDSDSDTLAQLWENLRPEDVEIKPVLVPANPERVALALAPIADALYISPVDAELRLEGGAVIAHPGEAGQWLDVDKNMARVMQALVEKKDSVTLDLETRAPDRPLPEPARERAEIWLAQPFTLVVDDPLTGDPPRGYHTTFSASVSQVASWLTVSAGRYDIRLYLASDALSNWLEEVSGQLGEGRYLDMTPTLKNVLAALYAGQHEARGLVRHPSHQYTVQPGDTLSLIAYEHQLPMWQIEKSNPGIDPGAIDVGQVITIPSVDVLFPHPLVPGKRIEVDLKTQTTYAYENEVPIYTFTVSSGISRTPTIDGQFQILFKEEAAFARRWQLDMPYFMAIYEEDEGFFNGFHELPITSYGVRLSPGVLGWPASFGCIILDVGDAETLYTWADVGTFVRITGYAPGTPTWQQTLADLAPLEEEE